ncbi:short-chain dehydrogenase [Microdochium trichocladiopsis]|uniref:Short-chain dehydrogenase n=1 Tax=Microdochium trichocladiopsis TaxID=1682393 RepID=A0A9P8YHJ9_9PEZI|nr:short-chain dehydrogenase [Microdochium trichocladiopsis]KAH7040641.1 short-chain dehydrogenase [Microdochium trichocladiopsis]
MAAAPVGFQLPEGAVWFITGCSTGIGRALVQHIASKTSDRVVATARNPQALSYVDDNDRVLKVALDVKSKTSIDAAVTQALQKFGRIDVVVNNAGYNVLGDTEAISDEAARAVVDTDFWGMVDVTRRVLPVLRETNAENGGKQGGLVMNVSSMGGFVGYPGNAFYHSAKFAMEGFTESVAKEMPPDWNIHFSIIEPGGVETNFATTSIQIPDRHPAYESNPHSATTFMLGLMHNPEILKNFARVEDVAAAMYGIASRGGKIPLRVPLGPDAWSAIQADVEQLRVDIEAIKDLSMSVGSKEQLELLKALDAKSKK